MAPQSFTSRYIYLHVCTTAPQLHNSVDLLNLWHKGSRTKPGLMHAPGNPHIFQRQWRTMLKNVKAYSKVKFNSKPLKDKRFGRFSRRRPMYALRGFSKPFKRWTLYVDRISDLTKPLKDERRGHKNHHMSWRVKVSQNVSKRLKARQMCVDDENAISKKPPLLIAQDTQ